MAFPRDKIAFLAKLEAVNGTPIAIAAPDFDCEVLEPEYTPMIEMDGGLRPAIGSHAELRDISGAKAGQIKFKMNLGPASAAGTAPKWGKFMKACGQDETDYGLVGTSYSPLAVCDEICMSLELLKISRSGTPTGIVQKIGGAMGNFVLGCAGIGKPLQAEFTFLGKHVTATNINAGATTALNVLTAPDTAKPYILSSATFTVGGVARAISSWKLDAGNKVELEIDPADANGGDYRCAGITARNPKFTCNPLLATAFDPVADQVAQTTATLILILDTAGSIPLTITMPVGQVVDPKPAVRENEESWDISYKLEANGTPASKIVATLDWEETFEILLGAKA